jgi:large subunit ribosomal protein L10
VGLNLEQKQAVVAQVKEIAATALSAVGAEYRGLPVGDMTRLRAEARKNGVYMRVLRNTLARRAVLDTPFECMRDALVGPLILAFSRDDPGAAARVVGDFARTNDKLVVKLVALKGRLLAASDISRLASLPTKEQAISVLMATMKAPVEKLARTLAEPHARLVRTLAAVRDQKEAA